MSDPATAGASGDTIYADGGGYANFPLTFIKAGTYNLSATSPGSRRRCP